MHLFTLFCSTLIILVKDRIASHVIEGFLESDHKPTLSKLLDILATKEHLVELACHPVANFVVQKLIVKSVSNNQVYMITFLVQVEYYVYVVVMFMHSVAELSQS